MSKYFLILAFLFFAIAAWVFWPDATFEPEAQQVIGFDEGFDRQVLYAQSSWPSEYAGSGWWVQPEWTLSTIQSLGTISTVRPDASLMPVLMRTESWEHGVFQVYAKIPSDGASLASATNTLCGFSSLFRIQDANNYYAATVGCDGWITLKKISGNSFEELGKEQVFVESCSDCASNLPRGVWLGVEVTTMVVERGLRMSVALDVGRKGEEQDLFVATDEKPLSVGKIGIHTTFKTLQLDDISLWPDDND